MKLKQVILKLETLKFFFFRTWKKTYFSLRSIILRWMLISNIFQKLSIQNKTIKKPNMSCKNMFGLLWVFITYYSLHYNFSYICFISLHIKYKTNDWNCLKINTPLIFALSFTNTKYTTPKNILTLYVSKT